VQGWLNITIRRCAMRYTRQLFCLFCIAFLVLSVCLPVFSADDKYPSKVITIIVPFSAGGPSDTIARLVAQTMSVSLKNQIIVESVAGAGGTIGAARVA